MRNITYLCDANLIFVRQKDLSLCSFLRGLIFFLPRRGYVDNGRWNKPWGGIFAVAVKVKMKCTVVKREVNSKRNFVLKDVLENDTFYAISNGSAAPIDQNNKILAHSKSYRTCSGFRKLR